MNPQQLPEVASLKAIQSLTQDIRQAIDQQLNLKDATDHAIDFAGIQTWDELNQRLGQSPTGIDIRDRLNQQLKTFLDTYGYLSDVATDIAVPTWKEDPRPVQGLILQYLKHPSPVSTASAPSTPSASASRSSSPQIVQSRVELKGKVAERYNRLLAELRWTIVALESNWRQVGHLEQTGDIFFLTTDDIQAMMTQAKSVPVDHPTSGPWTDLIQTRRSQLQQHRQQPASYLVYGNAPLRRHRFPTASALIPAHQTQYQGIGASPGQISGSIIILSTLNDRSTLAPGTILVVPYTDAGWAPLLTQASGIIAEVGGQLSHGAIIAREYGIPAVMNIPHITQSLKSGQVVELDGTNGSVTIVHDTVNSD